MKFIVALLGNKNPLKHDQSTMLGITSEPVDRDDILWCAFSWGFGAYNRNRLVFLCPIDPSVSEFADVNFEINKFLPNLGKTTVIDSFMTNQNRQ